MNRPAVRARHTIPIHLFAIAVPLGLPSIGAHAESVVYADDFNRAALSGGAFTYTTTAVPIVTATTTDGGAKIFGDQLVLTNDNSAATNTAGRVSVATETTAFSGFNPTLSLNPGVLTWTFNLRWDRLNAPGGFGNSNYGQAFILGATGADFAAGTTSGYALTLGNAGAPDPFKLVTFSNGLVATPTAASTIITAGTAPFDDPGTGTLNHYWSFKITYTSAANAWALFGRDDGSAAFSDPSAGTFTVLGTGLDSTLTSAPLTHLGAFWSYSTAANQTATFDNFKLNLDSSTVLPKTLVWNPPGNIWSTAPGNANWLSGSGAAFFGNGDTVNFTDPGTGVVSIDPDGVSPAAVNVSNAAGTYTFQGGAIAGGVALTKTNEGILVLASSQTFASVTIGSGSTITLGESGLASPPEPALPQAATPVPEPASTSLIFAGVLGLFARRFRRIANPA